MKKVYGYILIFLAFIPVLGYSQYSWSRVSKKSEYICGIGPAHFLGDLGGSSSVGTHFLKDFNFYCHTLLT